MSEKSGVDVDHFIQDAEKILKEQGNDGLQKYIEKNGDTWRKLERELLLLNQDQQKEIKRFSIEVKRLQKSVVEWLPDYPISKKIAVIINGDSREARHVQNTQRAINVLQNKGFDEVFVLQDESTRDPHVRQFPATKKGLDALFGNLKGVLQKDALVFVYGTGHGSPDEGGSMVIGANEETIGVAEIKSYMKTIKDSKSRILGVFDGCYSAAFPKAIIEEAGLEGIVLSPGIKGVETQCQSFAIPFFNGLDFGRDINKDGKTQISELFVTSMEMYREHTKTNEYGEYLQSKTELTEKNFDQIMAAKKPVIIDINTTWCGSCKSVSAELARLSGLVGEQVEIVTITDDKNPDKEKLYKKLGVKITAFPNLLLKVGNKIETLHARNVQEFEKTLKEKANVSINQEQFLEAESSVLAQSLGVPKELIKNFASFNRENMYLVPYMSHEDLAEFSLLTKKGKIESIQECMDNMKERALWKMIEKDPALAVVKIKNYEHELYADQILQTALENLYKNNSIEKIFSLLPFYKDKKFSEDLLLRMIQRYQADKIQFLMFSEDDKGNINEHDGAWAPLFYLEAYQDQPYVKKILLAVAEKWPFVIYSYESKLRTKPYGKMILQKAKMYLKDK